MDEPITRDPTNPGGRPEGEGEQGGGDRVEPQEPDAEKVAPEPVGGKASAEQPGAEETTAEEAGAEQPRAEEARAEEVSAEPPTREPSQAEEAPEVQAPVEEASEAKPPAEEAPKPKRTENAAAEPKAVQVAAAKGDQVEAEEPEVEQLWYVIHTQTGQELKVKSNLDGKIEQGLSNGEISEVLVPTERVAEIRGGKKHISERKFFPGYLLIKMEMTDESWHLVRTTPGVTGFIGAGRRPVPLSADEVNEILRQTEERRDKPAPRVTFQKGEGVRVTEGPFTNFSGVIEEVNLNRGKLKVMVSIFGRQTPVELEFWQVERL